MSGSTALLAGIIFLVAVVFSMLGQGGGTLYTPVQVFFGIDFHVAATTGLFLIMVTSFSSTLVFRKAHKLDWSLVMVLETVTTLGGLMGGVVSSRFSGGFLRLLFAVVVAFAALCMIHDFARRSNKIEPRIRLFH
jgi:uncharacterized protein